MATRRRAGIAYAVNTVGCIAGPLVAGFVALPLLGERGSLVVLAAPLFVLPFWPHRAADRVGVGRRWPRLAAGALAAGAAGAALVFLRQRTSRRGSPPVARSAGITRPPWSPMAMASGSGSS